MDGVATELYHTSCQVKSSFSIRKIFSKTSATYFSNLMLKFD